MYATFLSIRSEPMAHFKSILLHLTYVLFIVQKQKWEVSEQSSTLVGP